MEDDRYLTCSDDATLRLYSSVKRRLICLKRFDVKDFSNVTSKRIPMKRIKEFKGKGRGMPEKVTARCVGISNDDSIIVVGMKEGTLWVISCDRT